ncbi:antirestriction protein ArdA [Salinispora pacifica]|uniref:antirestriction protein ArdA n=1 Tax=Salinispora pacifica TaxID=351187 RepID=UPI00048174BF|nr:antirestriction protein ArdA [Salinispora pacifica]
MLTAKRTELQVWVGCLDCYNHGRLVGQWYDASEVGALDIEQVHRDGGAGLTGLPSPDAYRWSPEGGDPEELNEGHEGLWVFDHDGFCGLLRGECSPSEAQQVAEVIGQLEMHEDVSALATYVQHEGVDLDDSGLIERFREAYCGEWESEVEYAQDLADDLGVLDADATWPCNYIDWDRAARDLFIDDYWSVWVGGKVQVFHNG